MRDAGCRLFVALKTGSMCSIGHRDTRLTSCDGKRGGRAVGMWLRAVIERFTFEIRACYLFDCKSPRNLDA
jgi:hypothetical protein